MKRLVFVLMLSAGVLTGFFLAQWWSPGGSGPGRDATSDEPEILYWVARMDANYRRDEPGKSPMGMDLVPVYADPDGETDPAVVKIDPVVVNNLGVRTARVETGSLARIIDTVGYVAYDESTLSKISTRVDGWIEKLNVDSTGESVKHGQILFELYSPALVNAQEEFVASLASRSAALHEASADRLRSLGFNESQIKALQKTSQVQQRVGFHAPKDGIVVQLSVREGMYITPASQIMSLGQLDTVWLMAEVFERQVSWVEPGQRAEVQLDYLPGRTWQGTVDYVYPELSPSSRTARVRIRFDNPDEYLRPNMFARIRIFGTPVPDAIHIPLQALIRGGSVDRVVLAEGDGRFRSKVVVAGIESGDRVQILSGLAAGETVVSSAQFLIDSESNIDAEIARMERVADGSSDTEPAE
ncbi:MAG: efflux RND transporter periplasmic adaptor subunit [Gammaproteobacteria bacterium]|nr:efflux RND transporter periplasmic adaptor subunit [Gammaproteobacteria bacterium]